MNNTTTERNANLDFFLHITGDNKSAVATVILHAPSGLERTLTVSGFDMHTMGLQAISTMLDQVRMKEGVITLTCANTYILTMFGGGYKAMTPAERDARLPKPELKEWSEIIRKLKNMKNRLELSGLVNDECLERAKATAIYNMRLLKAKEEEETAAEEAEAQEA